MAILKKLAIEVVSSKKALATIVAVLLASTNRIGLQLPETAVMEIVGAIMAYVVGQGLADAKKQA